jgi:hypothetical protein
VENGGGGARKQRSSQLIRWTQRLESGIKIAVGYLRIAFLTTLLAVTDSLTEKEYQRKKLIDATGTIVDDHYCGCQRWVDHLVETSGSAVIEYFADGTA